MFDFTFELALNMLSFSKNIFISFDTLAAAHNITNTSRLVYP